MTSSEITVLPVKQVSVNGNKNNNNGKSTRGLKEDPSLMVVQSLNLKDDNNPDLNLNNRAKKSRSTNPNKLENAPNTALVTPNTRSNSNNNNYIDPNQDKLMNFRAYQNQKWKIAGSDPKLHFKPNNLTNAIENLSITDDERYQRVLEILSSDNLANNENEKNSNSFSVGKSAKFINYWNGYALRRAADYGYTDIVKILLEYEASPTFYDCEPLRLAAQNGHLEIVKILFKEGCRMDSRQEYALRAASRLGRKDVVAYLLSLGADPRVYDGFALACTNDPVIKQMLDDASINKMNEYDLKNWKEKTNYGKYGQTYCSEFDVENLAYAEGFKVSCNSVGLLLILIISLMILS